MTRGAKSPGCRKYLDASTSFEVHSIMRRAFAEYSLLTIRDFQSVGSIPVSGSAIHPVLNLQGRYFESMAASGVTTRLRTLVIFRTQLISSHDKVIMDELVNWIRLKTF